ncbi:hypothetical protein ASPZODRAFT_2118010 [Penicilliopsis zonata CBS 506.65]|uniref:Uncharacterized protein n=1 Tax=Penicilliopsis zonata CBS 506.65 TaxID=1073090 RepID=A0A1L9ST96_9EURO|nr:hypothetical protein ASPZODRAFT_2118010 [Penicilliopsis zonata CBS 506.65]OJJ50432.1 hypothetical protein ASPZODRAFT_2118010 [Penicilliopsis zonata CBS 506.65]
MKSNHYRPRITWWMRLNRFIYTFESPLCLRGSLTRLRHRHSYPLLALLRLFLPLPTWHFSLPNPVPFMVMRDNFGLFRTRASSADLVNMRSIPVWRARDTPIRSIYRIYEAMAAREYVAIGPEVEYFWYQARHSWSVHCIPDPCDHDPIRYAILACIAEELADAFNWRLSQGLRRDGKHIYRETLDDVLPNYTPETAPSWTRKVPPIDVNLIEGLPDDVLDSSGKLILEQGGQNLVFAERNIVTNTGYFRTI